METTPFWVYWVGAITGVVSALTALGAMIATWVSAKTARDAVESARRPYVWADVRVDADESYMVLAVGNSGPTIATNVRVEFTPPLGRYMAEVDEGMAKLFEAADAARQLEQGLASLTPGQVRRWALGSMFDVGKAPGPLQVRITADGPTGPLKPLSYAIHPADLAGPLFERHWSVATVRAIENVATAVRRSGPGNGQSLAESIMKRHQPAPPAPPEPPTAASDQTAAQDDEDLPLP